MCFRGTMTTSSLVIARGFIGLKSGYTHGYNLLQQRMQSKNSWQKKIHMGQNPERSDTGFQVPPQQGSYKTYSLSWHRTYVECLHLQELVQVLGSKAFMQVWLRRHILIHDHSCQLKLRALTILHDACGILFP